MNYVALLRGVNISGKNKIVMSQLKSSFIDSGFTNVSTYINSGNIIFSDSTHSKSALVKVIRNMILADFNLDIPVTIIQQSQINTIIRDCPTWWTSNKELVTYAIFPIQPIDTHTIISEVGPIDERLEYLDFSDDVIYWQTPLKTFRKSKWSKIASSSMNDHVTIRSINTVLKIQSILDKIQ